MVRTLLALGPKAQVRFFDTVGQTRQDDDDVVDQLYAVTYEEEGEKKSFFVAVQAVRHKDANDPLDLLEPNEQAVVGLVAQGFTNEQIAARLGYHDAREIPNYWTYAKDFVLNDHMFEPVVMPDREQIGRRFDCDRCTGNQLRRANVAHYCREVRAPRFFERRGTDAQLQHQMIHAPDNVLHRGQHIALEFRIVAVAFGIA